jgi:hypothetical protein
MAVAKHIREVLVIPIVAIIRITNADVETRRNGRNLQESANEACITDRFERFVNSGIDRKRSLHIGHFNVDGCAIVEKKKVKAHGHCLWELSLVHNHRVTWD